MGTDAINRASQDNRRASSTPSLSSAESNALTGEGVLIPKVNPFFLVVPCIYPEKWQPRSFCLAKDTCRDSIVGVD